MKKPSALGMVVLVLAVVSVLSVVFRHSLFQFTMEYTPHVLFLLSHTWLDVCFPIILGVVALTSFFYKRKEHQWFLPLWVAIGLSLFVALFSQEVLFSGTSQNILDTFFPNRRTVTFPSLHSTLLAAMTLPLLRGHKDWRIPWALFLCLTAVAEVTSLRHVMSDVLGGGLLGLTMGAYVLHLEDRYQGITQVSTILHKDLEMRRQIAHALMGIVLVALLYMGWLTLTGLGVLGVLGIVLSVLCKYYEVPLLYPILRFFERESHLRNFPGKGPLFFIWGSFLAVLLFPLPIALASIMILGIGDSFTNLLGRTFGKTPFFYNKDKKIEGPLYASMLAAIGASFFAPITYSFIASPIALFVESLPLRIGPYPIDDNLTIPLVSGGVMLAVEQLLIML